MSETGFLDLTYWQLFAIGLCFVWSGFVRSGLGFGGAALTLPLLLMIENDPLLFLPAICWQLLLFSVLTVATRLANVDWSHLTSLSFRLAVPFVLGLLGLLNLSPTVLSLFVYGVTLIYGGLYALNRVLVSRNRLVDNLCLLAGGYASGVSLVGAPLIVAYSTRYLPAEKLRDTLFVMWIVLVIAKLSAFTVAGVSLQVELGLLTLPLAGLGHWLGLKAHHKLVSGDRRRFNQVIGIGLCSISILGLWAVL